MSTLDSTYTTKGHPVSDRRDYLLRHTRAQIVRYWLTGPALAITVILVVLAAAVGGGAVLGRTFAPPVNLTQVTVTKPELSDRVANEELAIIALVCSGDHPGTLRVSADSKRISYITISGPDDSEVKTAGNTAIETTIDTGEYSISYPREDMRLNWSTTGATTCSEKTTVSQRAEATP